MRLYPAMFQKDGDYILVTFPDVPEAITQGKDLQEAYARIRLRRLQRLSKTKRCIHITKSPSRRHHCPYQH